MKLNTLQNLEITKLCLSPFKKGLQPFKNGLQPFNKGLHCAMDIFIAQIECGAQNLYMAGIANDVFKMFLIFFCVLLECRGLKKLILYQICSLNSRTTFYCTAGSKVIW